MCWVAMMITISVNNIFSLYIFIILLVILAVSFFTKRRSKMLVRDKELFNCPICAYRYIINSMEKIHRCPQCESLNTQT